MTNFTEVAGWAIAHKSAAAGDAVACRPRTEIVVEPREVGAGAAALRVLRRLSAVGAHLRPGPRT
jgi:hypothetical protein